MVLVLPTFSFTYLFDDYDFLGRAQSFHPSQLLPDPATLFYRPISREIYFGILSFIDPNQPLWGRFANGALLIVAVTLLASIVSKLAGLRAGVASALALASLGTVPILVGWTSGCQDLLAIVFVLAALRAQISGRTLLALAAAACALLSKETAVAFFPAIVLIRWLTRATPYRLGASVAGLGLLVVAWAAIHPGIRLLLSSQMESGGAGAAYLTFQSADRWTSLSRGLVTLANFPITGAGTPWPEERNLTLAVAAALMLLGIWGVWRLRGDAVPREGSATGRLVIVALLLIVPPLLLISFLVRYWQPYYLALPAIGVCALLGVAISRLPWLPAAGVALVFLALGVWCRGMDLGSGVPTERTVREPMERLRRVESSFLDRIPRLQEPTHLYLSVYPPEEKSIAMHLFRFQAARIWYRNRSVDTMHPEWRRPDPPSERLVWVDPDLRVHEIDTQTLAARPPGPDSTTYEYGASLRAYAQGLAATGGAEPAVQILLRMHAPDLYVASFNRRLAAALLMSDGRNDDAAAMLRTAEPIDPEDAIVAAGEILSNPSRRDIDAPVLEALGMSLADTSAVRAVMRRLALGGRREATIRFARRLLESKPNDWEALALLRWIRQGQEATRVLVPVVADSLW